MAKKAKSVQAQQAPTPPPEAKPTFVTFALRMTYEDREAIHAAAGRGKASAFALAALRAAVTKAKAATK